MTVTINLPSRFELRPSASYAVILFVVRTPVDNIDVYGDLALVASRRISSPTDIRFANTTDTRITNTN